MCSSTSCAPEPRTDGQSETHLPNRAVKKLANCSSHRDDCDNADFFDDDLFGAGPFSAADVDRGVVETQG